MKRPKGTGVATIIVFCAIMFTVAFTLRAQTGPMSSNEFQALAQSLETTTPLPASEAPRFGNFYTITHGENLPPYPGDVLGVPFWSIGGNFFILDDRNYDYNAVQSEAESAGGFHMDDGFEPDFQLPTTNQLWLQITGVTNGTARLIIHPPSGVTNGVYDLLYCTNLVSPSWYWLLHTDPGQTNLAAANATNAKSFYRLGPPIASMGTNFWVAFPFQASGTPNAMTI